MITEVSQPRTKMTFKAIQGHGNHFTIAHAISYKHVDQYNFI